VSRGYVQSIGGYLTDVEEHHNIAKKGYKSIYGLNPRNELVEIVPETLVSMNMWGFTPDLFSLGKELFTEFLLQNGEDLSAEFYIPYVVNRIIKSNKASCKVLSTPDQWFGVTYKEDRENVVTRLSKLIERKIYPSPLFKK
jgi:hypothetical protein